MRFDEIKEGEGFVPEDFKGYLIKISADSGVKNHRGMAKTFKFPPHKECRKVELLDPKSIKMEKTDRRFEGTEELINSAISVGIMNPILINKEYELLDGWYRLNAALSAELTVIPAIVIQ